MDEQELESLRRDAARYRWLKVQPVGPSQMAAIAFAYQAACGLESKNVDDVIDAAMADPTLTPGAKRARERRGEV